MYSLYSPVHLFLLHVDVKANASVLDEVGATQISHRHLGLASTLAATLATQVQRIAAPYANVHLMRTRRLVQATRRRA